MKRMLSLFSVLFLGTTGCSDQPLTPETQPTLVTTPSVVATANGITISSIEGPTDPVAVNTPVKITAHFAGASGDTHTGVFRWGDGASSVATIIETDGTGTATATRSYVLPGVYTVQIEISNQGAESVLGTHEYVTVYDPDGGYVSGNGAILSPPNACTWSGCVADEGAARFGFSSRYRNGATVPDGNTRFTFRDGNFTFSSTAYEWLVIAGARAQYKGVGTVNRQGNFGFMLTAIDSDRAGGGAEDRFRIKIWDRDNADAVVYDNQGGEGDDADLVADGTRLTRGSITVRSTTRNEAPVVIITAPTDGATFLETEGILLSADAGDAEDGDLSASVVWSSDLAGELGVGAELPGISLAPGSHTITARVTDSGGLEASASVAVKIAEVTISISPTAATISEGETQQFTATVYADGVEMLSGAPTVAWSSSDVGVATVDSNGLATGVSAGNATITASVDDVTDASILTVEETAVAPEILAGTITAGYHHSCGLDTSGAAYCWGYNDKQQLGTGTYPGNSSPVAVIMPTGVSFTSISAGSFHTVALSTEGVAYGWGDHSWGKLGTGGWGEATPAAAIMPAGVTFTSISAGDQHTVALSSTGDAYAWGNNAYGQLGDGTVTQRLTPVLVSMPAGVTFTSISAGDWYTVAVTSTGAAYGWGDNTWGKLGDGTTSNHNAPMAVSMPAGVSFTSIAAGSYHSVALASTGEAYAWGNNVYGQLGDGTNNHSTTPIAVSMPTGVTFTSVSSSSEHAVLAVASTGTAYAWGYNNWGKLGDGTSSHRNMPVAVDMPAGVTFVSANFGRLHAIAVASTGDAYAWGYNGLGQLGTGNITSSFTPVAVTGEITFAH
jgi:alpha-tubulin suppressor-like RCC1 family protein